MEWLSVADDVAWKLKESGSWADRIIGPEGRDAWRGVKQTDRVYEDRKASEDIWGREASGGKGDRRALVACPGPSDGGGKSGNQDGGGRRA